MRLGKDRVVTTASNWVPEGIDLTKPSAARAYDALLGGAHNFEADRAAVDAVLKIAPEMGFTARANRAFLGRVVRYLAAEAGIRQFLDIGTGIPTAGNTHQVAQAVAPESRVVYVDYDPVVLAHARALLDSNLVESGLVPVEEWRQDPGADGEGKSLYWCAVGRKR